MAISKTRRSGVALIVVLGLVAILMIVSVTFTIHMRVERAGAANLRHAVIARQIVKGGLGAALMAIDKQAGASSVPEWYDRDDVTSLTYRPFTKFRDGSQVHGYLWRDTFISFNTNNTTEGEEKYVNQNFHTHNKKVSGGVGTQLFSEEVARYFPAGLAYRGYASAYSPVGNSDGSKWRPIIQPQWQPIFADAENDNVMGRYAFFALDTTCLLDASCMTNSANSRWMGRDPGEMDVSLLPDVKNAKEFTKKNFDNGTYETLAEFSTLNPYVTDCRSFNTLSYDPGPTNDLVYIGGSADALRAQKADIIQAFVDSGLTAGKNVNVKSGDKTYKFPEQACWAYLGLVDYVDDDEVMEDDGVDIEPSARPATERMPLVCGFYALLTVQARQKEERPDDKSEEWTESKTDPVQVKFAAKVKVPFAFPFFPYSSFPPGFANGLELEGKAVLQAGSKGGSTSSKKEKRRTSPKDPDECIVRTIEINQDDEDGWIDVVKAKGTLPTVEDQLLLPDVWAVLRVGGATFRKVNGTDTIQHSFPAGKNNYGYTKGDKEVGFDDGMGMVVQIVGTQTKGKDKGYHDVWLTKDGPNELKPTNDPTKRMRIWETNIVVWAEIVDPRFASKAVVEKADEVDGQLISSLFKASHAFGDTLGTDPCHSLPLLKLQAEAPKNVFGGFKDAKDFEKKCQKNAKKEFGENDASFGSYFKSLEGGGASPFVAYLLEHPKAVKEFYGMPMDGIQIKNGDGGADVTTDAADDMVRMYVKNGPLESVGELGYLPVGMWQTIRLYDYCDDFGIKSSADGEKRNAGEPFKDRTADELYKFSRLPQDPDCPDPDYGYFHPVLDYFTVVSGNIVEGRININTLNSNILAVAFHNMPIFTEDVKNKGKTSYRIDSGITGLKNMPSRNYLAESIIAYRKDMKRSFGKLSELGYLFSYGDYTGIPMLHGGEDDNVSYPVAAVAKTAKGSSWGEFEREAVIRNSCGLFTMRGQSFIVVVRGESYSAPFGRKKSMKGGTSNSSKTAIAEVWRDSIPDANGNHPMYVQFFKILDD